MSNPLRIIFAGTPDFAVPALQALLEHSQSIVAIYTQPDRPAGRGRKPTLSPVKFFAMSHALPVRQPEHFKDKSTQAEFAECQADLMIVAAYGLLLPGIILTQPRLGCINIHASLLPRWRGASPIQHAILAGDTETGITIMQMEAGLDTGPCVYQQRCPIFPEDNATAVHDRLADLGAKAIIAALPLIASGSPPLQPQDAALVTYAPKLSKQDARIDWHQPAKKLVHKILAFNPWPVAETFYNGMPLRIWSAVAIPGKGNPGVVFAANPAGIDVGTGEGLLRITRLQLPNRRISETADFINSYDIKGAVFE